MRQKFNIKKQYDNEIINPKVIYKRKYLKTPFSVTLSVIRYMYWEKSFDNFMYKEKS